MCSDYDIVPDKLWSVERTHNNKIICWLLKPIAFWLNSQFKTNLPGNTESYGLVADINMMNNNTFINVIIQKLNMKSSMLFDKYFLNVIKFRQTLENHQVSLKLLECVWWRMCTW